MTTPTNPQVASGRATGDLQRHLMLGAQIDALHVLPSARSQKWIAWPYLPPTATTGTTPFSIIEGLPHSLEISTFPFRCHHAS